jgi:hypothetical protein
MPEDLAIDASADTGVDTTPVDSGADIDVATPDAGIEPETPETDEPAATEPGKLIVDGKLSPAVKAALTALKADPKNAAIVGQLTRDAFLAERIRREGGIEKLQELQSSLSEIEQIDPERGIEGVRNEINGWREFDSQFIAGDPKVLEFLTETPEGMQAFLKIVPMAMEKYRQAHPDGFANYVSQVFVADMHAAGLPLLIERLQDFIQDKPQALQIWEQLKNYVARVQGFATKQPALPQSTATAPKADDTERQRFEQERTTFTRNSWKQEANAQHHNRIFNEAWKRHVGDRKIPPQQQAAIVKYYKTELAEELGKKQGFDANLEKFLRSNQKDGFMKLFESTYRDASPLALRRALAAFGIGKPGPKTGGTPATPAKPGAIAPKGKPDAGFVLVNAKPNMQTDVNRNATTPEMWAKKQAILRDGKRVTWK